MIAVRDVRPPPIITTAARTPAPAAAITSPVLYAFDRVTCGIIHAALLKREELLTFTVPATALRWSATTTQPKKTGKDGAAPLAVITCASLRKDACEQAALKGFTDITAPAPPPSQAPPFAVLCSTTRGATHATHATAPARSPSKHSIVAILPIRPFRARKEGRVTTPPFDTTLVLEAIALVAERTAVNNTTLA